MSELEDFKADVAKDYENTEDVRRAANIDFRFIGVDGGMWEDFLVDTHHNDTNQRARLELDITSDYVMRFVGEWTLNRANVSFTPDETKVTEEDAELLSGIYRSDFKDNGGQVAQDQAIFECAVGGMGAFKLSEKFVDEEDPENDDQEIVWEPIHNAFNHVMFDCNAKLASKADAKRVTVLTAYTKDAFKGQWPDADPVSAYTPETRSLFNWGTPELIYVAERYEIKKKKEDVQVWQHVLNNQVKAYKEEDMEDLKPELIAMGWEFVRKRKISRQTVEKSIFTGDEFLEEPKRISGKYLPIIPVYGFRTFIDGIEHFRGLVRKLKDSNRVLNTSVSRMLESSASSGDAMPILTRQQVEGLEPLWADRTSKNYMVINDVVDVNGNPIYSGPVGTLQPPAVDQNTMQIVDIVSNYVQRQTGNAPQDSVDPDASGKAINALRKRENLNTQIVSDNIVQSIKHSGDVYRSKAADIYTRARMKKSVGEDGTSKMVQLNQLSLDPQSGNAININDLTQGRFTSNVEVGPQYESQKEATIESIERVMERIDQNSPYFGPLLAMWMENITGTGLKPLKKFNRDIMLTQGLAAPDTPEEQQQVAAMQQKVDPQDELVKAATEQQLAEAENLKASSAGKQATAIKDMATAEKTKAETAEIVVDINMKQQDRAAQIFERFASNTQIPAGQA